MNIKNDDCKSILYCIAAAFLRFVPRSHREKKWHYQTSSVKCKNVRWPTPLEDIPKLEIQNRIKINVYHLINESLNVLYKSNYIVFQKVINVLLLKENNILHYVWIKDIKWFKEKPRYNWICRSCSLVFDTYIDYKEHICSCDTVCIIPKELKDKKGLLKIKCVTNDLEWSITAAVHPLYRADGRRENNTKRYSKFYTDLDFPDISDLTIEKAVTKICNKCQINVNIFIYESKKIIPFIIPGFQYNTFIDLLMISNGKNRTFMIITSLSSIYRTRSDNQHFVCRRCLEICMSEKKLIQHIQLCCKFKIQKVSISKEKNLKFKNFRKQYPIPFIIYSDFEAILTPLDDEKKCSKHKAIAVAYKLHSTIESETRPTKTYVGNDCVKWFLDEIVAVYDSVKQFIFKDIDLNMGLEDELNFQNAINCHICGKLFSKTKALKVRDHDHMTGTFISNFC